MQARGIERDGGHGGERAHRLGLRFHEHQHAPHVRVPHDRDAALLARLRSLNALIGEGERTLKGAFRQADALEPHRKSRRIHHDEHVFEPAILLADQLADGAAFLAVRQNAGGARMNAELVLDRQASDIVALAERAVRIHQKLRHQEQRNALDAFRRSGRAGQHHMDDVVREIVFAVGDEDLLARNLVAAVAHRLGARADRREIRSRLRLGEVHGAGPNACTIFGR